MRSFLLFFASLLLCSIAHAQVPSSFNYQGVVRDGFNVLIANQPIGVQASIVQDSVGGASLYSETHSVSTNANGLFSIQIGMGTAVSGSFNSIDWTTADLHYQIEIDLQGGSNYSLTSFHSFTSVPYAMMAQKAVEVESGALPANANKGDILYSDGSEWKKLAVGSSGQRLTVCGDSLVWTYGECEPAGGWNPKGAYIDTVAPGLGCLICDNYLPGETFSLTGQHMYTAVDRTLLENMLQSGSDLSKVCVSLVSDMSSLFSWITQFNQVNQDISSWDVSNVTNMNSMFSNSSFNKDIGSWDVSNVTDMTSMFYNSSFNKDIGSWDVSNVTDMGGMFSESSSFGQDIGNWDVSSVTRMTSMFSYTSFNNDISSWDVSNVTNMNSMFWSSGFNKDIGSWDVSNVTDMGGMFSYSDFNKDIGSWDVSNVTNMNSMFGNAYLFNQNLSGWCVTNIPIQPVSFSFGSPLSAAYHPIWGTCPN